MNCLYYGMLGYRSVGIVGRTGYDSVTNSVIADSVSLGRPVANLYREQVGTVVVKTLTIKRRLSLKFRGSLLMLGRGL